MAKYATTSYRAWRNSADRSRWPAAAAVNEAIVIAKLQPDEITAVAAHGAALFHDPPNTIQWLNPAFLASRNRLPGQYEIGRHDLAAGGQGAPLVPFTDYILFRHSTLNRIILNIGGIANITYLPAGATVDQVRPGLRHRTGELPERLGLPHVSPGRDDLGRGRHRRCAGARRTR